MQTHSRCPEAPSCFWEEACSLCPAFCSTTLAAELHVCASSREEMAASTAA